MVDVVAVPDERQHETIEPAEALLEREHVGQRLARMLPKRQPVDDRDRRLGRELDDDGVRPGPCHDRVDEPLEVPGHVAGTLARAHDDVLGQVDRVAAELVHSRFERDAGPQARALEEHRDRPPGQRRRGMPPRGAILGLQLRRPIEDPQNLGRREVRNGEKIATA